MFFQSNATSQNKNRKLQSIYEKHLSKFECVFGPNLNNPIWVCNDDAPNGWAEFYGKKLKDITQKINREFVKKM